MASILDNKDDITDAFKAAEKHWKQYFEPFAEWERLARNKPHPNVAKAKMPPVTDGTLAAVNQAQPRRTIQQLPTGKVVSVTDPELALLADFIWVNQILPNANTQGDPLQKSWVASSKAGIYGGQWSYQFFNNSGEYFGGDFMLPYNKDVLGEPGKLNVNDSEYIFMVSWWTKGQIKALIEREKRLKKQSKERGEFYDSSWNLSGLSDLLDDLQPKDQDNKNPTEQDKDQNVPYGKIVHALQRGVGAKFFSYSPKLDRVLKTKPNNDPRGCIPLKYLYDTVDLSNPLGRGKIELSGGMQNLLDSEVQSYQFSRLMGMAPPLKKWGSTIANSTVKWKPFAVWDMGSDKNSDLVPVDLNTSAIQNFPTNYGLIKSQILNLTNNQDTSISAESGNPSFSKTQAGVNAQQQRIATDDNYARKNFETWYEAVAEDVLNIHFAESSGVREVELTQDFLKKVPPGFGNEYFQVSPQGDIATVMYDAIKTKLKFEVDASTTQLKDDQEQMDRNLQLLELAASNPIVGQYLKIPPLINRIVTKSGVDDPEELLPTEEEIMAMQQQQQMMAQQQAMQPQMPPGGAPPQGPAPQGPPPEQQQPQLAPEDEQLIQGFLDAGFTEDQAMQGLTLMHNGYDHDQIMEVLSQAQGAGV